MRYNLADETQAQAAFTYLTELNGKEAEIEIVKVSKKRTNTQNSYLHVILAALGNYLGYNMDEIKTVYKRHVNPTLYVYDKRGQHFLKSSTDLSVEEMSASIDKLRTFADSVGYPLPSDSDVQWIRNLQNELEQAKYELR